ncbi:LysE family transporter [Chitinophaga sedimenti]|uniref:LysE family translocator n=1 Tax=Chitinophaga sedimenti TaxID=2033606 RepID=UPI002005595B|nr:LysE family transporter [Chitinophaga sedimenti]MCK7558185.1 LysE family transporter [Chitinophaga sedimenti]
MGPVIFAIIKYSINNGFKAGISFALGVSISDILFVVAGNIATSFISGMEAYSKQIGIVGGILLMCMGLYGLLFKKVKIVTGDERPEMFRTSDYAKIWTAGFLMNTLNPGVIVFWLPVCIANSALPASHRWVTYGVAAGHGTIFRYLQGIRSRQNPPQTYPYHGYVAQPGFRCMHDHFRARAVLQGGFR